MTPVPAPDASTDDVVAWLLGVGHFDCLDEDGRPLGEQASPVYSSVARDERRRRFGDQRDETQLPCNMAALAQLQGAWAMLIGAVESFAADRPPSYSRMLRRAEAGTALGPLWALRHPERRLSRQCAALYKVNLGYTDLLATVLMDGRGDADSVPTAGALAEFIERDPWLIGDRQVCAGTRAQIDRMWAALQSDGPDFASDGLPGWGEAWFDDALTARHELAAMAAAAAGAARTLVASGAARNDATASASLKLYTAGQVPRWAEALRQVPDAGPLHPTLLFSADDVPASVRGFVETLRPRMAVGEVDDVLVDHAKPVAARLMRAVGRPVGELTAAGFRCATGEPIEMGASR